MNRKFDTNSHILQVRIYKLVLRRVFAICRRHGKNNYLINFKRYFRNLRTVNVVHLRDILCNLGVCYAHGQNMVIQRL